MGREMRREIEEKLARESRDGMKKYRMMIFMREKNRHLNANDTFNGKRRIKSQDLRQWVTENLKRICNSFHFS